MNLLEIQWYGPYRCYGAQNIAIFAQPEAMKPGIYLWAIPFEGQNLTYYVGETGRSFVTRFEEHIRDYLAGLYRVYDPVRFSKGEKVLIWEGMWKLGTRNRTGEFLNRYSVLAQHIYELLGLFRIFIAPLDIEQRVRERIEAGIAGWLYKQTGIVGTFQDNDIRYRPRRATEKPITIIIKFPERILGLCDQLEI